MERCHSFREQSSRAGFASNGQLASAGLLTGTTAPVWRMERWGEVDPPTYILEQDQQEDNPVVSGNHHKHTAFCEDGGAADSRRRSPNQPTAGVLTGIDSMNSKETRLFSGGHRGAEAEFGRVAEEWKIPETTFTFEGHAMEHSGEVRMLSREDLARGDVSMDFVFANLGRRFHHGQAIRRVIQSMFHVVTSGDVLFAIGWIQPDDHVKGGTGWGVELAKFFNRPVSVFDQDKERWYSWSGGHWEESEPTIPDGPFAATGTRNLTAAGREAIRDLFERSFGSRET